MTKPLFLWHIFIHVLVNRILMTIGTIYYLKNWMYDFW